GFEVFFVMFLIVANGLFAMSEIAIICSRKARLQRLAEDGNSGARVALDLADSPNLLLSTVQVGITLIGVLSGAFSGAYFADPLAHFLGRFQILAPYSQVVALIVIVLGLTYLSLVIGELVPKRLALNDPERIASRIATPMRVLSMVASPAIKVLSASTDLVLKLLRMRPTGDPPVTEEEIRVLIDQATVAGVFDEAEQDMVERVFRLGDRRVGVLMTPRRKINWLDIDDSPDRNRRRIMKSRYSRFPVSQGRLGNILGVVHVKDLLNRSLLGQPFDLKPCLMQPLYVLESMQVLKVLEAFRESGNQMALIVDEYGTIEGMVTLNDVLEAIIGDIPSLDAVEQPRVTQRGDGSWLVDGMLPVDEFKDFFHIRRLPDDKSGHFHTLGGFIMTHLGRIPVVGDRFETSGLRVEVVDMDGHRVDKVLIDRIEPATEDNGE
ncbi:MAG: HlyC/CorC family transporter, partial [Syntrophobacteraceae bacterium]|nr:HlyC/CorC family transporter [Syntrophobacteraceae bacterium]